MGIVNFNELDLDNDFEIDYGNFFYSDRWDIPVDSSEYVAFNFSRLHTGGDVKYHSELITLIRMMTYYAFPKKVRLKVNSWYSSEAMFSNYVTAANTFLIPRGFITCGMFTNLTLEQCQSHISELMSLAEKKIPSSKLNLLSTVVFFDSWIFLSEKKYLPQKYRTHFKANDLIASDTRKEITKIIEETTNPWTPLEPEVVKTTYDYSKTYINNYSSTIIKCHKLIRKRARFGKERNYGIVRKDGKTKHLFQALRRMKVPEISRGVKLFNFIPITKRVRSLGYASGWQDRTYIRIDEIRPEVINLKRACIFIIGLLTGLRRREIANLKAKPAYLKNGSLYLDIVRFKTSSDPNDRGEPDSIPVPEIVGDAVNILLDLFEDQRNGLNSEYLITTDILSKKGFEKAKIATISKDIIALVKDVTGNADGYPHRLRKTIAWLIISRSETNIDLIRQLFGHKSFGMTLRYIMRNHLMVASVMELLEHNYTEDLKDILDEIANNNASGALSEKIKARMNSQRYKGQVLITDLETFIKESLASGVPLFVSKVPIGGFCLRSGESDKVPPCMVRTGEKKPNIDFCDYKICDHLIYTEETKANIKSQINYYQQKLNYLSESANEDVAAFYENEIADHENLLYRLKADSKSSVNFRNSGGNYDTSGN
ncbi:tyrosine-type recombinase/integrase [Photobacterium sagamiensis]|uniref:tyrosine-type recombinase/integrase n=1 Tax=Photobacterium sagamiensis TaxID=2910241 RepID=UPI003D0C1A84